MDKIRIIGGTPLKGEIPISGAKNAALPLMAASLLTEEPLHLVNVPDLADIKTMINLLAQHGTDVKRELNKDGSLSDKLTMTSQNIKNLTAPYDLVRLMRASVLVIGPLLARFGEAKVSLPGGCAIGARPVDLHLQALESLGASIKIEEGYIYASAKQGLKGTHINFPKVTVGATENLLMAACLAEGETTLSNAAREPEITDLANCLVSMGAEIEGIGTDTLKITGVEKLHGTVHSVVPDRIEAATYAIATAITRGSVKLTGARLDLIASTAKILLDAGVELKETDDGFIVNAKEAVIMGVDVMTEPYPGFPTDMQAQIMALMTTASGASMITETIFENRFMHVPELMRMGANINIHGSSSAIIRGVRKLSGAQVMATDLRASVSLVIAALAAEGETVISRVYHLDRGYEKLEEKLAACGADIQRITKQSEANKNQLKLEL